MLLGQPILTGVLVVLDRLLWIDEVVAPSTAPVATLLLGQPFLSLSIFAVFLAVFLVELREFDAFADRIPAIAAGVATLVYYDTTHTVALQRETRSDP